MQTPTPPRIVQGRYELHEEQMRCRFSTLFRGIDQVTRAPVVLRRLHTPLVPPEQKELAKEQFLKEGRLLKRLVHRNLPRVLDAVECGGEFFIVMEAFEGNTLDYVASHLSGRPSEPLLCRWMDQVAAALEYMHTQDPPVIYRDLRPQTVIMTPNAVIKLVDFGLARMVEDMDRERTAFRGRGATNYAAPEQFGSSPSSPRMDLYSLGATFYNLATGKIPPAAWDRSFSGVALSDIRTDNPAVSPAMDHLLLSLMHLQAAERPESAAAVRHQLATICPGCVAAEGAEPEAPPRDEAPTVRPQRPEGPPPTIKKPSTQSSMPVRMRQPATGASPSPEPTGPSGAPTTPEAPTTLPGTAATPPPAAAPSAPGLPAAAPPRLRVPPTLPPGAQAAPSSPPAASSPPASEPGSNTGTTPPATPGSLPSAAAAGFSVPRTRPPSRSPGPFTTPPRDYEPSTMSALPGIPTSSRPPLNRPTEIGRQPSAPEPPAPSVPEPPPSDPAAELRAQAGNALRQHLQTPLSNADDLWLSATDNELRLRFVLQGRLYLAHVTVHGSTPVLTRDELHAAADAVIVGRVEELFRRIVPTTGGSDEHVLAVVEVVRVEKGAADLAAGRRLHVQYRTVHERSAGWSGPPLQLRDLVEGLQARFFLRPSLAGPSWQMLEPNGWEVAGSSQ